MTLYNDVIMSSRHYGVLCIITKSCRANKKGSTREQTYFWFDWSLGYREKRWHFIFEIEYSAKGPSIKDVRTKSQKNNPLLSIKYPYWLNPLPPCPWGHTVNFETSEAFCSKSADVRTWRTPPPQLSSKCRTTRTPLSPWLRTSFMDGPWQCYVKEIAAS